MDKMELKVTQAQADQLDRVAIRVILVFLVIQAFQENLANLDFQVRLVQEVNLVFLALGVSLVQRVPVLIIDDILLITSRERREIREIRVSKVIVHILRITGTIACGKEMIVFHHTRKALLSR